MARLRFGEKRIGTRAGIVRREIALLTTLLWVPALCAQESTIDAPAPNVAVTLHSHPDIPKPAAVPPRDSNEIRRSIDRGVTFLLAVQNSDGSWGTAERTKELNIYAPIPGAHHAFRAAVTSLCVSALIDVEDDRDEVVRAIDRGEAWLRKWLPRVKRAEGAAIYNVWTHAYGVSALVRLLNRPSSDPGREAVLRGLIDEQIEMMQRYESVDGGWGYYDFDYRTKQPASSGTSFCTAAGLVALDEAASFGAVVPDRLVQRALASLRRQMKPDHSFLYGEYMRWQPMREINRPGGSLGRSQACNLALRRWGDTTVTDQVLVDWLDRLFARNGWLSVGRKRPIPHEAHFQVAGYFYYFGHYYAAECIRELPESAQSPYWDQLSHLILGLQESDGSWWDYPLYNYHQQYGTAFGLMIMQACLPPKPDRP